MRVLQPNARASMTTPEQTTPLPTEIKLHQKSKLMEVSFDDGQRFTFSYEFLRVHSPSAEVRGHGPGQEVLQTGKREVIITNLEAVGHYAVRPEFSDGHASGLFAWDYLYKLGSQQDALWRDYEARLAAAGARLGPLLPLPLLRREAPGAAPRQPSPYRLPAGLDEADGRAGLVARDVARRVAGHVADQSDHVPRIVVAVVDPFREAQADVPQHVVRLSAAGHAPRGDDGVLLVAGPQLGRGPLGHCSIARSDGGAGAADEVGVVGHAC